MGQQHNEHEQGLFVRYTFVFFFLFFACLLLLLVYILGLVMTDLVTDGVNTTSHVLANLASNFSSGASQLVLGGDGTVHPLTMSVSINPRACRNCGLGCGAALFFPVHDCHLVRPPHVPGRLRCIGTKSRACRKIVKHG